MVWVEEGKDVEAKPTLTYILDRIMENAPPTDSPEAECRSNPDDIRYAWFDSAIMAVGDEGVKFIWNQIPEAPEQKCNELPGS